MAEHAHSTPIPTRQSVTKVTIDTEDRPATFEFYAALEFEACPGVVETLGDRDHWMAGAADWWVVIRLSVAALERDHLTLAAATAGLEDEHLDLAKSAGDVADYLEGCVGLLRTANVRLLAAAARCSTAEPQPVSECRT